MLIALKKNIRLDKTTGLYTARECGRFFEVHPSLYQGMLIYLTENKYSLIAEWYRSLPPGQQALVKISGW